jgi:hypothetical protein
MRGKPSNAPLLALVLALYAIPAQADEQSGWAISAGIGPSLLQDRDGSEKFDGRGFGYTLGTEYRFSKWWAFGIDFFSLGSASDTFNAVDTTIDAGGFELRGRIIFPVAEKVEMYGRLGFGGYFAEADPGGSNIGEDLVTVGVGLDIGGGEHAVFRIDGRYLVGQRDETGALITAGFNYRF